MTGGSRRLLVISDQRQILKMIEHPPEEKPLLGPNCAELTAKPLHRAAKKTALVEFALAKAVVADEMRLRSQNLREGLNLLSERIVTAARNDR